MPFNVARFGGSRRRALLVADVRFGSLVRYTAKTEADTELCKTENQS